MNFETKLLDNISQIKILENAVHNKYSNPNLEEHLTIS